jgi:hypothetical protein
MLLFILQAFEEIHIAATNIRILINILEIWDWTSRQVLYSFDT